MPLNLDTSRHPQLRYTVRLEYLHPVYNDVEFLYIYMTDEEFEKSYRDIIEKRKTEICEELGYNEGWEYEISEWGVNYTENSFYGNEILSENVISLLKTGDITYPAHKDKDERELALAYLDEIRHLYTKEQVAKAILSVISTKPKVEIVSRILKVWGVSLNRNTYIEMQLKMIVNSNEMDLALGKLLKANNSMNLSLLKVSLKHLSDVWNLAQDEDAHRRSIIVYRFLSESPLIKRNNMSLKKGLETLSTYLNLPPSNYTKEVQLSEPKPKKDKEGKIIIETDNMVRRKARIYYQINSKWATFKAQYLK
ncbi:hypothetical protein [uncultured Duncaniella sp.]|uniref:hypothetical protein n=1 Tax=uncultured Duncaniella sp. TaxID=2768039 RepID=UPI00262A1C98|nr:hypothetical protein [uncultured Duncaniella sp.]